MLVQYNFGKVGQVDISTQLNENIFEKNIKNKYNKKKEKIKKQNKII